MVGREGGGRVGGFRAGVCKLKRSYIFIMLPF